MVAISVVFPEPLKFQTNNVKNMKAITIIYKLININYLGPIIPRRFPH